MTTEQAQKRLEEIRRLLTERGKAAKVVNDIDTQIARLAGATEQRSAPKSQQLTRNDFISISGGTP